MSNLGSTIPHNKQQTAVGLTLGLRLKTTIAVVVIAVMTPDEGRLCTFDDLPYSSIKTNLSSMQIAKLCLHDVKN